MIWGIKRKNMILPKQHYRLTHDVKLKYPIKLYGNKDDWKYTIGELKENDVFVLASVSKTGIKYSFKIISGVTKDKIDQIIIKEKKESINSTILRSKAALKLLEHFSSNTIYSTYRRADPFFILGGDSPFPCNEDDIARVIDKWQTEVPYGGPTTWWTIDKQHHLEMINNWENYKMPKLGLVEFTAHVNELNEWNFVKHNSKI